VKLSDEQSALSERLLGEGKPPREVARTFGVHKATLYRAMARRRDG
jgi:transposase